MAIPTSLAPIVLEAPLGKGGMATVFRAHHPGTGHRVAVKVLTAQQVRNPAFRSAFADEVRAVASMDHQGIISVVDYGHLAAEDLPDASFELVAQSPFLVMELAPEGTLEHRDAPLTWPLIRHILLQLLDALAHAHARGLIHRDIKPANVLCFSKPGNDPFMQVKLADFGISHAMGRHLGEEGGQGICGTPCYMAPEQFGSETHRFGPWTDLYALGCLAFELVTARPPFDAPSFLALYNAHLTADRPPLAIDTRHIPQGLQRWIHMMMAPSAEDRFRHAADAAWALLNLPPAEDPQPLDGSGHGTMAATLALPVSISAVEPERPGGHAQTIRRPPFPATWRPANQERSRLLLRGVGAGLYGLRPVPLIGRDDERDALWCAFKEVVTDERAGALILRGPTGSGKSRLATWLCHRAAEVGAAHHCVAYHSSVVSSVHPISSMLRRLYRLVNGSPSQLRARLDESLPDWNDADRRTLYDLLFPTAEADVVDASRRLRLYRRALGRVTETRPLVVWLDDVQFGEDALRLAKETLDFEEGAIFFVLTLRDEALATDGAPREALRDLSQSPRCQTLEVSPLAEEEHLQLVCALLGLEHDLSRRIAERTAGNPLFAVEVVGDWIEKGLLQAGPQGYALADSRHPPLPDDLFQLWNERIEYLTDEGDPRWEEALKMAALLDDDVDFREWIDACRRAGIDEEVDLDALVGRLLDLCLASRRQGGFSFVQSMFRETLELRARNSAKWAHFHRSCAETIQYFYGVDTPGRAERMTLHLLEAHRYRGAYTNALRATKECIATSRYRRARELLDDARRCLEQMAIPAEGEEYDEIYILRMQTSYECLDFLTTREFAENLLARAEGLDRPSLRAKALQFLAQLDRRNSHFERAGDRFSQALKLFAQQNDVLSTAACLEGLAWMCVQMGRLDKAESHYHRVLELFDEPRGAGVKAVGDTLNGLAEIARRRRDYPEALSWLERGESLARARGNDRLLVDILNTTAEIHRETGDLDAAESFYLQAMEVMTELAGRFAVNTSEINLMMVYCGRGEYARAMESLESFLSVTNPPDYAGLVEAIAATANAGLGRWQEAIHYFDRCRQAQATTDYVEPDHSYMLELLATLCEASHPQMARDVWLLASRIWDKLGNDEAASRAQDAAAASSG